MEFVSLSQAELDYLAQRDPRMGEAIARIGVIERAAHPEPFQALVHSIVGQLISRKAADTIHGRLLERCGGQMTPAVLAALEEDEVRGCGLSQRKAQNLLELARRTQRGELCFDRFPELPDEEIVGLLSALPGIGVWTVEMLLLFSMDRRDVLSYGDLGIRGGLCYLHGLEKVGKKEFEAYRRLYSPCGTAASLYLWELWAESQKKA